MDRAAAQARLDRIRAFTEELAALEQSGDVALEPPQRDAIAAHHRRLVTELTAQFDLDRGEEQRRMSLGMRVASLLAATALAAAVFLFFYRFWGFFNTIVQVGLLAGATIAGVALTALADRFDRSRHFVFVAALLACATFVLNVVMLGQIFAMPDSPNAFAAWAAFALAVGFAYRLRLPVVAGLGA